MDDQSRNLIVAVALSGLVLLFWTIYEQQAAPTDAPNDGASIQADGSGSNSSDLLPMVVAEDEGDLATPNVDTDEGANTAKRISISTERLLGSISLRGGRIDDLQLLDYNLRLNDPSEKLKLLTPAGQEGAYYAFHGWRPGRGVSVDDTPNANTIWTQEGGGDLRVDNPITLKWVSPKGLIYRRVIGVDEDYLFTIAQSVQNTTAEPIRLAAYGSIARRGEPETIGMWLLHEGVVRAFDGTIQEIDYDDMPDQTPNARENANTDIIEVKEDGWIGFTSKYWMTTLLPEPGTAFESVSKYTRSIDTYQVDMRLPVVEVAPGALGEVTSSLFAGAKEFDTIDRYEAAGFKGFVDSIDWGWFFFLTKPIFWVLNELNKIIGNLGFAIIGLTLVIKAALFPLAYKSYSSMARMKELQPEMEKLKEKHGDDRQAMQQDMMKLYRDKKVNPAAGCLPILLQIPIFFSLYKVLFVTLEVRHAPFIGWIKDLSAPDPSSILNIFGLMPWGVPEADSIYAIFSLGVWPLMFGISMWLQQKLNPAPTDEIQAQIFAWLPWVFMFMLGQFAAGLIIYWVASNFITFAQQYLIMRSLGVKPDILGNIRNGFKRASAKK